MIDPARRRRDVVVAGHSGDVTTATAALEDPDPSVRSSALRALGRLGRLDTALPAAFADPSPAVRRTAAWLAADPTRVDPLALLGDDDPTVVEVAAWALGERGEPRAATVDALAEVARSHADESCRESAVAALGAIGDERGLPAIVDALGDRPAVRRRAVVALAPFEGPIVDAALARAASDRDRQVRDAARALLDG